LTLKTENSKSQASQLGGTLKGLKGLQKIGKSKDEKLHIWLFNDVLVHLKSTKSKKKTNVASAENSWPLELVWVKDIPEIDPTDSKMPYTFLLVGPRQTFTLKFGDKHERDQWMNKIRNTVTAILTEENAPEDLVRYGAYEFPEKERGSYRGFWKFGRIHGQGVYTFYGNTYTGQFNYNKKDGSGTMICFSGDSYIGEWKDDLPRKFFFCPYKLPFWEDFCSI
jgi:hypothetical protein